MAVLNRDELLERAGALAGLDDFGDLPFCEALDAQLWALENESGNPPDRLPSLAQGLIGLLVKRLRLVEDRKRYPAIAEEAVVAPIFVLGLPRTGSTHLHALLGAVPGTRTPLQWEMLEPSPPPRQDSFAADPRIGAVQQALDARPNAAALQKIHPYGATRPEQCVHLVDWSFINSAALAAHRMPSYFEWFLAADHRPAYEHHRRFLQHLQWQVPGQWVLKWPKHVFSLQPLLSVYPDARIIWTHRDPATVVPSVANFVGSFRKMTSPLYDPVGFGAEWSALEEIGILRAMAARDAISDESRFFDIHYNDLVADPVRVIRAAWRHFGMTLSDEDAAAVAAFQSGNPKDKHGRHEYALADYGLTAGPLRERFSRYIDRFGIEPDRRRGA